MAKGRGTDRKASNSHIVNDMNTKRLYASPEVDILDIAVEDIVCQSPSEFEGNEIEDAILDDFGIFKTPGL